MSGFIHGKYQPERVQVLVNSVPIQKFAAGTFLVVNYRVPRTNLIVGSGGDTVTAFSADKSCDLTFTLHFDSPMNSFLESLVALKSPFNITVSDLNTGSTYVANKCVLNTYPEISFDADTPGDRTWSFHAATFLPIQVGTV